MTHVPQRSPRPVKIFNPRLLGFLLATTVSSAELVAQETLGTGRRQATRVELEQAIAATEAVIARSRDESLKLRLSTSVAGMRQRLKNGDFAPGDRIVIVVVGDSALTDTFTVKPDQQLEMPPLPAVSLRGVLDSELSKHLSTEIAKYVKDPSVRAIPLVRLNLSGGVGRPGFLNVPLDITVTDLLMMSGGPTQNSKLEDTKIRRGEATVMDGKAFGEALRAGRTVGDLSLDDGDEIAVGVSATSGRGLSWQQYLASATALLFLFRGGRRR
jgi:polysaccharide export outer membrane protein